MKRLLILGIVTIILLSSIPIYATTYNDGPEPDNPFYTKLIYEFDISVTTKTKERYTEIVWIYSEYDDYLQTNDGEIKLINNMSTSDLITLGNDERNIYRNGSLFTGPTFNIYNPRPSGYESGSDFPSFNEVIEMLNDGILEIYRKQWQNINLYRITVEENTIAYVDSLTNDLLIYPHANHDTSNYINIWQPLDGFKDVKVPLLSTRINYKLSYGGKWDISYITDMVKYEHRSQKENIDGGYIYGDVNVIFKWTPGQHSLQLKAVNKLTGEEVYSNIINVELYADFIDENKDGLDDRAKQPDYNYDWGNVPKDENGNYIIDDNSDGFNIGFPGYEQNPLQEWNFQNFFTNIGILITRFTDGIKVLINSIGQMSQIFTVLTSVIPEEILSLLVASILLFIILKIFHR